mgnify:CR=1 FL=1
MAVKPQLQLEKDQFFKQLALSKDASIATQRLVKQFLEALLYEKIVPFKSILIDSSDAKSNSIYDRKLSLSIGARQIRCTAFISSFDRIRISQGSVQALKLDQWQHASIYDLVEPLEMEANSKADLLTELEQTIALCSWNSLNLSQLNNVRRELDFLGLESAIHEGHLYHPCFKARRGFTVEDHQQFGPEAGRSFQFVWFAIHRQDYQCNLPINEADFWRKEIGDIYDCLTQILHQHGADWNKFGLMPLHPWQVASILSNEPASTDNAGVIAAIGRGEIINLGCAGDFYQASQSLRTVINVTNPKKANVKLPMNVMSTSSNRNLPEHFVITAPVVSNWLQKIVSKDVFLQEQDQLVMLSEYAAISYIPASGEHDCKVRAAYVDEAEEGLIGAIFRTSVLDELREQEAAIPFTALMLVEPDERLFVADWVEEYGIESWVTQLLKVAVLPIWHLLAHHGVGFESHAQNLVLIHKNGWPARIAMRDFHEDTEYLTEFLLNPEDKPDPASVDPWFSECSIDEGFNSEDADDLCELFLDSVCVFNLSELSFILEKHYKFSEVRFWLLFNIMLEEYEISGVTNQERLAKINIGRTMVNIESLLEKKIKQGLHTVWFDHKTKNALACDASLTNSMKSAKRH